jgi:class 3 adenylate cyclase
LSARPKKAAELGDRRWRVLLDAHDAAVRGEIGRARGREVKTTGDGFVAAFDGPAGPSAARRRRGRARRLGSPSAAACIRASAASAGRPVRPGAPHRRPGRALAAPGEVLVTSTVQDLVLGSGFRFEDRGTHALKGVPGEWRILAVAGT